MLRNLKAAMLEQNWLRKSKHKSNWLACVLSVFVCANVVADVAVVFVNLVMTVVLLALVLVLVLVFLSEFTQNVLSGWEPKMCTLC